jgi:hypothetical protein
MLSPAAAVEQVARQTQVDAFARLRQRKWLSGLPKWLVIAILFALCIAPTFISYQEYMFRWDDSDYLQRSIVVSQAFWSWDLYKLRSTMVGKSPAMTLLGLPWGPLVSWDAAGRCLMTLATVISLLAASCLYMLLRIGVKPFFLILASVCVGVSMGPYPHSGETHYIATGFYADNLLAWTALAAILLVPYEARTPCPQLGDAALRGIVWGSIFSLGMLTKFSFLYFVVSIVPVLFLIRLHYGGFRTAFAAVIAFALSSAPTALYFLLFGQSALDYAWASSFGWQTQQYLYNPLLVYLSDAIRDSPGLTLSLVLMAVALIYLVIKRRLMQSWPDFLALLIMIGFATIVIASPARGLGVVSQFRYVFPAIVALPFLVAILMSGKGGPAPRLSAALASGLVFCGLLAASVPTLYRASSQSLDRVNAVLAHAAQCRAAHIMLATDSPTLNITLLVLAITIAPTSDTVKAGTLAYNATMGRVPIDEDFRTIRESDQVVFQDKDALNPWWANLRVSEYERYVRQNGYVPIKVASDVTVYLIRCRA